MSEHHAPPGPDPAGAADKIKHETQKSQAKAEAAQREREAEQAAHRAEHVEEKAHDEAKAKAAKKADAKPAKKAASKAKAPAKKQPAKKQPAKKPAAKPQEEADDEKLEVVDKPIQPKQKPELDDETVEALEARAQKKAATPHFRRHEWWRYKRLGGKHASWRRPRGIHSKQRRHFKYRPPVVSIGYRGPRAARGLHPSGFEEVLVYRPEDLGGVDPKTQAARVGGTVGGRKAELIEKEADKLGIRVLNRRQA